MQLNPKAKPLMKRTQSCLAVRKREVNGADDDYHRKT